MEGDMEFDLEGYDNYLAGTQKKVIPFSTILKFLGFGAGLILTAAVVGYIKTGGRTHQEIQQIRQAQRENAKAARAAQMGRGRGGPPGGYPGEQDLASQLEGNPQAQLQGPPGSETSKQQREFQQNLFLLINSADQQLSKGAFDKAAQLLIEALRIIPTNIPQYDTFALDIIPKLVTCYLETNKAEEAEAFLNNMQPLLSKNPETVLSFNFIKVQVLDYLNKDRELEPLLLDNINRAQTLFGIDSVKYINQLYSYAMFLLKKKNYEQAIVKFQQCLDFHSSTSGASPSQEEFGLYRQIQRCYLNLGNKEEAFNILERIKMITEDPISVAWQQHHTGALLLETEHNSDAEVLFREILAEFTIPESGEFESPRIKSLVSNTISELAIYLYNTGRVSEAEEYFDIMKEHKWGVLSSSIYLVAKSANIYFSPKPDQAISFSAKINCEFSLQKRVQPGMFLEFETETLEGKQGGATDIQKGQITVKYTGKDVTKIESKVYPLIIRIYKDKSKKELLFTHFQFVPSSIDTTRMRSWSEIESGFKSKQQK